MSKHNADPQTRPTGRLTDRGYNALAALAVVGAAAGFFGLYEWGQSNLPRPTSLSAEIPKGGALVYGNFVALPGTHLRNGPTITYAPDGVTISNENTVTTVPAGKQLTSKFAIEYTNPSTGDLWIGVPFTNGSPVANSSKVAAANEGVWVDATKDAANVSIGGPTGSDSPIEGLKMVVEGNSLFLQSASGLQPVPESSYVPNS